MAQFTGFRCDSCGKVVAPDDRNKVTTRFEGPAASGECHKDLCTDCVVTPEGVALKPLRRRTVKITV